MKCVHACDWNEVALEGLRRGLIANDINNERCVMHYGDNRKVRQYILFNCMLLVTLMKTKMFFRGLVIIPGIISAWVCTVFFCKNFFSDLSQPGHPHPAQLQTTLNNHYIALMVVLNIGYR